ncbi:hypothetical protein Taro_054894, partial [Colocasia esculenta]|nr:hypothetical protein [Colocasia esculenta]
MVAGVGRLWQELADAGMVYAEVVQTCTTSSRVVESSELVLPQGMPLAVVMADRRDWGGGGDDPEESTQRMIERIWESLTDIRARMDQQAPVPPVTIEEVPVASVPPQPGVVVHFVAPV